MVRLENEHLVAEVSLQGAELVYLARKGGKNVLWARNTDHWNRVAPNLFPIVGRLKDDKYSVDGKEFRLTQHGFARDSLFKVEERQKDAVVLLLSSDATTLEHYPFQFELRIVFRILGTELKVEYRVKNTGTHKMPFAIGGHPGFQLFDDITAYELILPGVKDLERYLLDKAHFTGERELMKINGVLPLSYELFSRDAVVCIDPSFQEVTLHHHTDGKSVRICSDHWDAIGFWTKPGAPFLCIEPWWGYADRWDASGDLYDKAGNHFLMPGKEEQLSYSIELY